MAGASKGKASRAIVWVILGLLIVGLAGFGTANFGGSTQSVASVGEQDITVDEYARALQEELNAFQAQTGQSIQLSQGTAFGLDQAVLRRLLGRAALDNEARRVGVSIGDERVRDQVLQVQAFQGPDGTFDREAYRYALERSNLNESTFEDQMRQDTARTILQSAVVGGIVAPGTFTRSLLSYIKEARSFTWAELTPSDLVTGAPVPTDAQLEEYYKANEADFTLPETRAISYVWMTPEMIVDQVKIDDETLKAAYQDRISEFSQPERRLVERLVFATEEEAAAAVARINSGEITFDKLVEERGLTLSDADLGDVTVEDLGDAGAAVFALKDPGVAGPLPSALGPAIFRMNAILPAENTTFEEARQQLFDEIAGERARRQISDEITAVDDLLAGGATLEEVANETPMVFETIKWTPDSDGGIAGYQEFKDAAAAAKSDDFPAIVELSDGGIFALRLDEIIAPKLQPLADVRGEVIAGWDRAETTKRLVELANSLVPTVSQGTDMAALGLTATVEDGQTRDAFIEGTPPSFMSQIFEMAKGDVRVIEGDESAFVVRLDDIVPADLGDPETASVNTALENQTAQSLAQDIFDAFTRTVQTSAGISVNQAAINAVHAQFP